MWPMGHGIILSRIHDNFKRMALMQIPPPWTKEIETVKGERRASEPSSTYEKEADWDNYSAIDTSYFWSKREDVLKSRTKRPESRAKIQEQGTHKSFPGDWTVPESRSMPCPQDAGKLSCVQLFSRITKKSQLLCFPFLLFYLNTLKNLRVIYIYWKDAKVIQRVPI